MLDNHLSPSQKSHKLFCSYSETWSIYVSDVCVSSFVCGFVKPILVEIRRGINTIYLCKVTNKVANVEIGIYQTHACGGLGTLTSKI